MASFPTALKTFTNLGVNTKMDDSGLEGDTVINAIQDEITALQAKVGINTSLITSSIDYKLTNAASSNPGHKHTLAQGATDVTATTSEINKLAGTPAGLTSTELGYVDGVTSAIQTQINAKAATTHAHSAADITSGTMATARLGSGSATSATFLRGDQTYATPSATTDGWTDDTARTWTYVSAQTFTVTGDQTAIFTKGTRLKFTQTTVKYGVVISSSFSSVTTVTIATSTDYTIANAAITANYYSYQANPQGYPTWFNFTLANVVWDATPPTTVSATVARFSIVGLLCTVQISVLYTNAGTGNAAFNCDGPIPASKARASKYFYPVAGFISDDGGGPASFPAVTSLYGTTPVFYINKSSGTVAAKYAAIFAHYEI